MINLCDTIQPLQRDSVHDIFWTNQEFPWLYAEEDSDGYITFKTVSGFWDKFLLCVCDLLTGFEIAKRTNDAVREVFEEFYRDNTAESFLSIANQESLEAKIQALEAHEFCRKKLFFLRTVWSQSIFPPIGPDNLGPDNLDLGGPPDPYNLGPEYPDPGAVFRDNVCEENEHGQRRLTSRNFFTQFNRQYLKPLDKPWDGNYEGIGSEEKVNDQYYTYLETVKYLGDAGGSYRRLSRIWIHTAKELLRFYRSLKDNQPLFQQHVFIEHRDNDSRYEREVRSRAFRLLFDHFG